jgi:hypothetical protein
MLYAKIIYVLIIYAGLFGMPERFLDAGTM